MKAERMASHFAKMTLPAGRERESGNRAMPDRCELAIVPAIPMMAG